MMLQTYTYSKVLAKTLASLNTMPENTYYNTERILWVSTDIYKKVKVSKNIYQCIKNINARELEASEFTQLYEEKEKALDG